MPPEKEEYPFWICQECEELLGCDNCHQVSPHREDRCGWCEQIKPVTRSQENCYSYLKNSDSDE